MQTMAVTSIGFSFEHAVEAWKVLGEPRLRAEYDAAGAQWLMDRQAIQCAGCGEGIACDAWCETELSDL